MFYPTLQEKVGKALLDHQGIHTCIANLISSAFDARLMSDTKKLTIIFSLFEKDRDICYKLNPYRLKAVGV